MLLGVPVSQVIADIPDTRATTAGELAVYLWLRGWGVTRLRRGPLPGLAIARVVWPGPAWRTGHWIVRADGRFYDPGAGDGTSYLWRCRGGRIASHIALARPAT
jgi:hypothetical protein